MTSFNAGHTLACTIWKIHSPSVGTIVYAVNLYHMWKCHLDGTVLISSTVGTVFESLAQPDLLITDMGRANIIGSHWKDCDVILIGMILLDISFPLVNCVSRYHHHDSLIAVLPASL